MSKIIKLPANNWPHLRIRVNSFLSRHHHHVARKRTPTATFKIRNDYLTLVDIEELQTKSIGVDLNQVRNECLVPWPSTSYSSLSLSLCED